MAWSVRIGDILYYLFCFLRWCAGSITSTSVLGMALTPSLGRLLLLLALSPGGPRSSALAQDCTSGDIVVGDEERLVKNISITLSNDYSEMDVFVLPETGFHSVSIVVAEQDGTQHSAWFPAEDCLPTDGWWQQFQVWAGLTGVKNEGRNLKLGFQVGKTCLKECVIQNAPSPQHNVTLTLLARGASTWVRDRVPKRCNTTYLGHLQTPTPPTCRSPPPTGNSGSDSTVTTVVVVVVVLLLVLVVLGALYIRGRK